MNETELFLLQFSSLGDMAWYLGTAPSTISSWKKRNSIPRWWHDGIRRYAKARKIKIKGDFP